MKDCQTSCCSFFRIILYHLTEHAKFLLHTEHSFECTKQNNFTKILTLLFHKPYLLATKRLLIHRCCKFICDGLCFTAKNDNVLNIFFPIIAGNDLMMVMIVIK